MNPFSFVSEDNNFSSQLETASCRVMEPKKRPFQGGAGKGGAQRWEEGEEGRQESGQRVRH